MSFTADSGMGSTCVISKLQMIWGNALKISIPMSVDEKIKYPIMHRVDWVVKNSVRIELFGALRLMVISFPAVVRDTRPISLSRDSFDRLTVPSRFFSPPPLLDVIRSEPYCDRLFVPDEEDDQFHQGRLLNVDAISDSLWHSVERFFKADNVGPRF